LTWRLCRYLWYNKEKRSIIINSKKKLQTTYVEVTYHMQKLNAVDIIALVLVIIGGLNWGLTALGFNAVDMVFGAMSMISRLVYLLVGLSAIYVAWLWTKLEKK